MLNERNVIFVTNKNRGDSANLCQLRKSFVGRKPFLHFGTRGTQWVLAGFFKNPRGADQVTWRAIRGGGVLAEIIWYRNDHTPNIKDLRGLWVNTEGQVYDCSEAKCNMYTRSCWGEDAWKVLSDDTKFVYPTVRLEPLDGYDNVWHAADWDGAGIVWQRLSEGKTTFWDKLPALNTTTTGTWLKDDGTRIQRSVHEKHDRMITMEEKTGKYPGTYVLFKKQKNRDGVSELHWRRLDCQSGRNTATRVQDQAVQVWYEVQ